MKSKTMSKKLGLMVVGLAALSLQGCLVAAVGRGVGGWKWGDAKKAQAETQCKKEYPAYFTSMEKINKTRISRHEKAEVIMTIEEYCHLEKAEPVELKETNVNEKNNG